MANVIDIGIKVLWFSALVQLMVYPLIAKYVNRLDQPLIYRADIPLLYNDCATASGVAVKAGRVVALGDYDHLTQLYLGARTINTFSEYQWYPKLQDSPYQMGQVIRQHCGVRGEWYLPLLRIGGDAQFYLLDRHSVIIGHIKL